MTDTKTEREWMADAIKHRRQELGLRQKDLAALVTAAGPRWTQQIVGKVETYARDVSWLEMLAVCMALGTTPSALLLPSDPDSLHDTVAPNFVRFDSGMRLNAFLLFELFDGNAMTGTLADSWDHSSRKADEVDVIALLDLVDEYALDPDAITVAEYLDMTPDAVRQIVAKYGPQFSGMGRTKRKRWTTREILDERVARWQETNREVAGYRLRQVRTAQARELAAEIRSMLHEETHP